MYIIPYLYVIKDLNEDLKFWINFEKFFEF
jgi:hypothetical protein